MFTHVKREENEEKLHISHLHHYVSAYFPDGEMGVDDLVRQLEAALDKARKDTEVVIVDQDGEMCFHVCPSGLIRLMLPWKNYMVIHD